MDLFDAVAEWRPVSSRWFLHRPEPLMHERMWGCSLPPQPEPGPRQGWHEEGGFDAAGRPVAWRQISPDGEITAREIAVVEDDATVVRLEDGGVARTLRDEAGRAVRTEYAQRTGEEERYEYDDAGRLVTIHENPGLWFTAISSERLWPGGRLTVEYDGDEPSRITGERGLVWERARTAWEDLLRQGADEIAARCVDAIGAACREEGVPAGTEVFALCLTYVDQGSVHPTLSFGLEQDRRGWHEEGLEGEELGLNLLYVSANHEGLNFIDEQVIDPELDERLLREACINQTGDPYRAVLGEVAKRLATASLEPMLRRTEDFVVFIAEHDEGLAAKVRSIHAHNPPEQVARWEASWPAGAPRGEDECW